MSFRDELVERLRQPTYRHAYLESFLNAAIATQIQVLREQRKLTQAELAELSGMKQSQISALEDIDRSSWKVGTLAKLARAFDVALVVRFESVGAVLPDIEQFGRDALERASFDDDPVFSADTGQWLREPAVGTTPRYYVPEHVQEKGLGASAVQTRGAIDSIFGNVSTSPGYPVFASPAIADINAQPSVDIPQRYFATQRTEQPTANTWLADAA